MDINKYIGNKIRGYREQKSLTQEEVAEYLNTTPQTISRYEIGDRKTNQDILFKLAEYFKVSINDFFPPLSFDNASIIDINSDMIKVPVYGTIKAGVPIESQSDIVDYIEIPKKWTNGEKKFFGIKLSGDSMYPKYQDGDTVIFEQNDDMDSFNGKDVAVMINGTESTFKRILVNDQGIILQPYNTAYDIMMFSKKQVEELPIKVVGIAREKRTKL